MRYEITNHYDLNDRVWSSTTYNIGNWQYPVAHGNGRWQSERMASSLPQRINKQWTVLLKFLTKGCLLMESYDIDLKMSKTLHMIAKYIDQHNASSQYTLTCFANRIPFPSNIQLSFSLLSTSTMWLHVVCLTSPINLLDFGFNIGETIVPQNLILV